MKTFKLLLVAAGLTALAACDRNDEANNAATDLNATDNMALPPAENVDMNADMNNMTNDMNTVDNNMVNTADNTTNSY